MGGQQDGGANALLLIFCSLDIIRRVGGPWGAALSGLIALTLLIAGIVWLVVWANTLELADVMSPANASSRAKGERHTPDDRSTTSFWTNFLFVLALVALLTTPTCYYAPAYRGKAPSQAPAAPAAPPAPAETGCGAQRPLLAVSV